MSYIFLCSSAVPGQSYLICFILVSFFYLFFLSQSVERSPELVLDHQRVLANSTREPEQGSREQEQNRKQQVQSSDEV